MNKEYIDELLDELEPGISTRRVKLFFFWTLYRAEHERSGTVRVRHNREDAIKAVENVVCGYDGEISPEE